MALLYLTVLLMIEAYIFPTKSLAQPLSVYIDGSRGKDSLECLNSSSSETPCQSLSFVAENLTQKHFVHIEILSDVLNLTRAVNFTDYCNLNISGSESKTALFCNESNAGVAFEGVINLSIDSLTIENCGAPRPSTARHHSLSVAVYVLNCTNMSILNVDIVSSNGTGLSVYDTNGEVDIMDCNFINNSVMGNSTSGGGGLYVEFTICPPGSYNCSESHSGRNDNSQYIIQNSNFTNNSAQSVEKAHLPLSHQVVIPRLGQGGGLFISIGSDATNNTIILKFCNFRNNRASYNAGGMIVKFLNSAKHNNVYVFQTKFYGNKCMQTQYSSAGGLTIAFMTYNESYTDGEQPQKNIFQCDFCSFKRNRGNLGGGTAIYSTKHTKQSLLSIIIFSNSKWVENESAMGAAAILIPAIWDYTKVGFLPIPTFRDCKFESNSAVQKLKEPIIETIHVKIESVGFGALFISEFHVIFEGNSHFSHNIGSAIHLSASVIDFKEGSNVLFGNNTSHRGGAVEMHSSTIKVSNSSSFLFVNNRADTRGGAIYSDFNVATHPADHNCFISSGVFSPVNSTFIFQNNSAGDSGASIFTTTFQSCSWLCPSGGDSLTPEEILHCIANFIFNDSEQTNSASLSTRPDTFKLNETSPIHLIPGLEYYIPLLAYDEAHNSLHKLVYAASVSNPDISIDSAFSQVSNNTIKVNGKIGVTAKLKLFTADVSVLINISLRECKPGFHYNHPTCECAASEYWGLKGCDPNVYLRQGYWIGYCSENSSKLCTALCPYGYCSYTQMHPGVKRHELPDNSSSLDWDICGPRRKNRLCGECSSGYSMYYNSRKHKCDSENLCHLGWLFYILSDLLPITLLFIVVVLVLNVSFTTGNTNCFVLYGQVLGSLAFNANDSIQFSPAASLIQMIVTFPYSSFNMNFFTFERLSFCLRRGASFLEAMMVNYVTVGFALALVLLTIIITKYQCVRNKILCRFQHHNSILIHGLSAFFILCYSQAARTSFHILDYSCLYSANFTCAVKVVTQAGHLTYLEGEHVPYAVAASLVLTFMIIIPPLLLLAYPLMFKLFGLCNLSETKLVTILWRMMPIQFLDAFQSSFKDKYRFFAGLYFLYRAVILAFFVRFQSWLAFYSTVQILLIIILTVHSVLQPHKEKKHNIVDSLLFANLTLINAITLFYYGLNEYSDLLKINEDLIKMLPIVQAILIISPLVAGIVFLIVQWKLSRKRRNEYEDLPSLEINRERKKN